MNKRVEESKPDEFLSLHQSRFGFQKGLSPRNDVAPFSCQLLKWIGNKQRFAHEIISFFPSDYETYYEPFLGSGAVLGTLSPKRAIASDILDPLIEIWKTLAEEPGKLVEWYAERWREFRKDREDAYEKIRSRFNREPNPADLLFLSRSCYGGVIRFRKEDGYMSTPLGIHDPVSPNSLKNRVDVWRDRIRGTIFLCADFEETMRKAGPGDLIYCDPPYSHTQAILYGAQAFSLPRLFDSIREAKERGAKVALSIDGMKKSGSKDCKVPIPEGLFARTVLVNCGRSMLRRFQMEGESLESEVVSDRLLLTWD